MTSIDFDAAPYIPILGSVAGHLAQVTEDAFASDPHTQASALLQVAGALRADAITVGWRSAVDVGVDVVSRLPGRAVVALLNDVDAGAARSYCEAGVAAIFLFEPGPEARDAKYRQVGRAAAHYDVPVLLADARRSDGATFAASVGLAGAVVSVLTGDEAGIVGGGLSLDGQELRILGRGGQTSGAPPRGQRFFWTFPGEVPAYASPEDLAALGARL